MSIDVPYIQHMQDPQAGTSLAVHTADPPLFPSMFPFLNLPQAPLLLTQIDLKST